MTETIGRSVMFHLLFPFHVSDQEYKIGSLSVCLHLLRGICAPLRKKIRPFVHLWRIVHHFLCYTPRFTSIFETNLHRPRSLAKQGDNALGSVRPSACPSSLSRLNSLTCYLDIWCVGRA